MPRSKAKGKVQKQEKDKKAPAKAGEDPVKATLYSKGKKK